MNNHGAHGGILESSTLWLLSMVDNILVVWNPCKLISLNIYICISYILYIYIYIEYIYIYIYKFIQQQDTPHVEQSGVSQTSRINDNPWKIQPLAQDCLEGKPLISPIKAVSSGFCILYFSKVDIYLIGLLLMNKQSEEKYKSPFTHEMRSFSKSLTKSKNTSISSVV